MSFSFWHVSFQGGEDPLERRQPTPVFLPEESHGQRRLAGYSPWDCKHRTRLKWLSMQALSLVFCALFVYNSGVKHSALNVLMCHNEKELCSLSHISLLLSYLFSPTMFHQKCSENIFLKTYFLFLFSFFTRASQIALVVKNLPTNVGDIRDSG